MHRRLRWGNVARAAGAALALALIVAWPRLAPPETEVPGDRAMPLGAREGRGAARPGDRSREGGAESSRAGAREKVGGRRGVAVVPSAF